MKERSMQKNKKEAQDFSFKYKFHLKIYSFSSPRIQYVKRKVWKCKKVLFFLKYVIFSLIMGKTFYETKE